MFQAKGVSSITRLWLRESKLIIIIIIIIIIRESKLIIIIIIIITLFKSQIILAKHKCSTNWGDCKSNKSN